MNERACRRCGRETWSPRSPYCREHGRRRKCGRSGREDPGGARPRRRAQGAARARPRPHRQWVGRALRSLPPEDSRRRALGPRSRAPTARAISVPRIVAAIASRERGRRRGDPRPSRLSPHPCAAGHRTGTSRPPTARRRHPRGRLERTTHVPKGHLGRRAATSAGPIRLRVRARRVPEVPQYSGDLAASIATGPRSRSMTAFARREGPARSPSRCCRR